MPKSAHRWSCVIMLIGTVAMTDACAASRRIDRPRASSNEITQDEIARSGAISAYDAITKLRGNFLSYRGATSMRQTSSPLPIIYVDGTRFGDVSALKGIPAGQIAHIRLYRANEAQTKFGDNNMAGVIEVSTRTQ